MEIENYNIPQNYKLIDVLSFKNQSNHEIYSNHEIRITKNGFAYFCPNTTYFIGQKIDYYLVKPNINLLEPFEIFTRILSGLRLCHSVF